MRAVVQRVASASVEVDAERIAEMGPGLLVLVGVGQADSSEQCEQLARKLVGLRLFPDAEGRFDRSVQETGGTIGLVSQFTLYGDARRGRRPSFSAAAAPERARPLFDELVAAVRRRGVPVVTGRFGASMRVALVNDGPVTLWLDTGEVPTVGEGLDTEEGP